MIAFEACARAPAVLGDELDAGRLKGAPYHVEGCAAWLAEPCLQALE
jgi:hypothetical protein